MPAGARRRSGRQRGYSARQRNCSLLASARQLQAHVTQHARSGLLVQRIPAAALCHGHWLGRPAFRHWHGVPTEVAARHRHGTGVKGMTVYDYVGWRVEGPRLQSWEGERGNEPLNAKRWLPRWDRRVPEADRLRTNASSPRRQAKNSERGYNSHGCLQYTACCLTDRA